MIAPSISLLFVWWICPLAAGRDDTPGVLSGNLKKCIRRAVGRQPRQPFVHHFVHAILSLTSFPLDQDHSLQRSTDSVFVAPDSSRRSAV